VHRAALLLAGITLAQGAIGAIAVSAGLSAATQALHAAGGVATWSAAIVVGALTHRRPVLVAAALDQRHVSTLRAYIQLTKPGVMSLLLATTAVAMIVAAHGMPSLQVFVVTLLGGALMAGGAGAINHYVDRDIDPLMGRTAWRPIPAGVIEPRRALWFGIALGGLATVLFVAFVNVLAAALALAGLLGYVFVYSLWLKRSTPSSTCSRSSSSGRHRTSGPCRC
jgi:protoheme IX farnesyltransferase